MLQSIVVYVIVLLAVAGAISYLYRKFKALRKGRRTGSACEECPLKNNCTKPAAARSDCCSSEKEKP